MPKIVIFALDRASDSDAAVEARRLKRGDVIKVVEDDAPIGKEVREGAMFRVISVPGNVRSYRHLLAQDVADVAEPDKLLKIRIQSVDLDTLESDERGRKGGGALRDDEELAATGPRVLDLVRQRAPMRNRRVIG